MAKRYSRRRNIKEKKDTRKAFIFIILTVVFVVLFFIYGLPFVVKYAAFLTNVRNTDQPIESQDTTPPPPPRLEDLPDSTNETAIEISGSTEPGATVTLHINSDEEEVLANSDGQFNYTIELLGGNNTLYAIAKDSSGNESQKSETIEITYDDEPPELEITSPEDGATYYGSRQRQVIIEGTTEEDAKVQINDRLVVVESDGTFAYATSLTEGENQFTVVSEDEAGNSTETSLTLNYSP